MGPPKNRACPKTVHGRLPRPAEALAAFGLLTVSLLAGAGPATAEPPIFSGLIPDVSVEAGVLNFSAYDFGPHFSDPDGNALSFSVVEAGSGRTLTDWYAPRITEWGPYFAVNGTRLELSSLNATGWGRWSDVKIVAFDGWSRAESNGFAVYIKPPPVTQRTWAVTGGLEIGVYTNTTHNSSCTPFTNASNAGIPTDAIVVDFSTVAWRQEAAPDAASSNGSVPPPPGPAASLVFVSAESQGVELLNVTVDETPRRVHFNASAINGLLENSSPAAGMAFLPLNMTVCILGGSAGVTTRETRLTMLRLPPGADRSNPNPHPPAFSGPFPDVNVTAGWPLSPTIDLAPFFGDGDADPLSFAVGPADGAAALAAGASADTLGGAFSFYAANSSWTGDLEFVLVAEDPFGERAESNTFVVHVSAPVPPPAPGAEVITQADAGLTRAEAAVAVTFAVAAMAIASTEAARYALLGGLLGALASRGKRPSLLDHFVRGQLFQIIKENPGIHFTEILRRGELANGSASHHLRVLEKGGLVRVVLDGLKTRFYITGEKPHPSGYGLSPADRQVLDAVFESPGIEQFALVGRLGLSKSRVNRSVSRLTFLGFVLKSRRGKSTLLYPRADPPPDAALLRPFTEGPE